MTLAIFSRPVQNYLHILLSLSTFCKIIQLALIFIYLQTSIILSSFTILLSYPGFKFLVKLFEETDAFRKYNSTLIQNKFPGCESHEAKSDAYYECYLRHVTSKMLIIYFVGILFNQLFYYLFQEQCIIHRQLAKWGQAVIRWLWLIQI